MNIKDCNLPDDLEKLIVQTVAGAHAIQREIERLGSREAAICFKNMLMIPVGSLNKNFELPPNTLAGFKDYLSTEPGFAELKRINFAVTVRLRKTPVKGPRARVPLKMEIRLE